jgi:hypothetical protein
LQTARPFSAAGFCLANQEYIFSISPLLGRRQTGFRLSTGLLSNLRCAE